MLWIGEQLRDSSSVPEDVGSEANDLGALIIDMIDASYQPEAYASVMPVESATKMMSVTRTSGLDELAAVLDVFALAPIGVLERNRSAALEARLQAQSFGCNELVDIGDSAITCRGIAGIQGPASALRESIDAAVARAITDEAHPGATGLTLCFPMPDPNRPAVLECLAFGIAGPVYATHGLELLERTHWGESLERLCGGEGGEQRCELLIGKSPDQIRSSATMYSFGRSLA